MKFHISPSPLHPYFLDFKISFVCKTDDTLIKLPLWRPGRYQVQTFAKNIRNIGAESNGKAFKVRNVSRNTWSVLGSKEGDEIILHYEYYARHQDAGGTWVSNDFWLINGIGCGMLPEGLDQEEIDVIIDFPVNFEVATAAIKKADSYHFSNFEEWTETPFMAGSKMHHQSFVMEDSTFHIWLHGNIQPDWTQIVTDFKKFTQVQLDIFGGFPHSEFHYLCLIPSFRHYHGVEHPTSTVITLGPATDFNDTTFYENLLGISSHELFHVWNIKGIRPKELKPYPLFEEVYFDTGYVAEGVTTYFGDEILYRSGAYSKEQYKNELNKLLTRHFENQGRYALSVADSSLELWTDGYEKGIPARKTSIYVKGAVAALILDSMIKTKFDDQKSLDDVMKLMWERFGENSLGYTSEDYKAIAEEVFEASLDEYFNNVIFGTDLLEDKVQEALHHLGWETEVNFPKEALAKYYGLKVDTKGIIVDTAARKTSQDLVEGDKIISINDIVGSVDSYQKMASQNDVLKVIYERDSQIFTKELYKKKELYFAKINVT
ncbi:M61 family peptidase [Flammeovirga sp. SubArs3]|uniref:M61 family metallopeptidase n=1 Tax=Flammeovirga sp. SubArs3 TaxID=2995316 RepID=UPI00248D27D1|nr:M61 family peptidase [Flammeovirga sp. SubArs3]